jgi:phosphoadenosine phosphosulfate reductase
MQVEQATIISGADVSSQPIVQVHQASTSAGHPAASHDISNGSSLNEVRTPTVFEIQRANEELANAEPQQVLAWAMKAFPTGLYQTTAFGLTGLAALDMIHKLSPEGTHAVPLIFINTLYHFPETLDLAAQASQKYGAQMHVYMPPAAQSSSQFESVYGERLWEEDEESYDYLVKVSHTDFLPRCFASLMDHDELTSFLCLSSIRSSHPAVHTKS